MGGLYFFPLTRIPKALICILIKRQRLNLINHFERLSKAITHLPQSDGSCIWPSKGLEYWKPEGKHPPASTHWPGLLHWAVYREPLAFSKEEHPQDKMQCRVMRWRGCISMPMFLDERAALPPSTSCGIFQSAECFLKPLSNPCLLYSVYVNWRQLMLRTLLVKGAPIWALYFGFG